MPIPITKPASSRVGLPKSLGAPYADLRPAYALGGAIEGAGRAFQTRAEELKNEYDTAKVVTAYNEFLDQNREKLVEITQRQGEAAYGSDRDYETWFDKVHGEFMSKRFDSSAQQKLFDKHAQAERQRALDQVANHMAVQHREFKRNAVNGLLINTARESSAIVTSEQDREGMIANYRNAAITLGKSTAEIAGDIQKIRVDNVETLMATDPGSVPAYIEKYKGELGGSNYAKYTDQAKAAIKQRTIDNVQAQLQIKYETGGIPDFEAMRKELKHMDAKIVPYDVKLEVRQWLDAYEVQFTNHQTASEKTAHDDEERKIGMLYLEGDLTGVINFARKSKFLKGDELKTWVDAAKNAKKEEIFIDPVKSAGEIVIINRMISTNRDRDGNPVSPEGIRNYIIQSPYLKKEDKEQYINKLEGELATEIKEARKYGDKLIDERIIPSRSPYTDILKAPIETQRVAMAQGLLREWIDREISVGRYPSYREVYEKAMELATQHKPKQAELIEDIRRERKILQGIEGTQQPDRDSSQPTLPPH